MTQLHKRFTDDQVKMLLNRYCQGLLNRTEVQDMLGLGKTRLFALVKAYQNAPDAFSVGYERRTPGTLPAAVEMEIERELLREKARLRPSTTGSDNLEALLQAACTQASELLGRRSKLSAGTVAIAQPDSRRVEVTSGNRLGVCTPISPMPQTTSGQERSLRAPCPRGSTGGFRSFRDENVPGSLPWTTALARDGDPEPVNR